MTLSSTNPKHRFVAFVIERERIRKRREVGVARDKWTTDAVLRTHSFCNVNREHDRVTRWVRENVKDFKNLGDAVLQFYVARIFNEPPVLALLMPFTTTKKLLATCHMLRSEDKKLLRGAYMVAPHGRGTQGVLIEEHYSKAFEAIRAKQWDLCESFAEVAELLLSVHDVGPFMANQVIADLRYSGLCDSFADWETFILAGPGTQRGLNRYFVLPVKANRPQKNAAKALLDIRENVSPLVGVEIADHFRDINNLSNCFCEFDKYERARDQETVGSRISLRKFNPQN